MAEKNYAEAGKRFAEYSRDQLLAIQAFKDGLDETEQHILAAVLATKVKRSPKGEGKRKVAKAA